MVGFEKFGGGRKGKKPADYIFRIVPNSRPIWRKVGDAMVAIENGKPTFKGIFPQINAWPDFDEVRVGEPINLLETIDIGDKENHTLSICSRPSLAKVAIWEDRKIRCREII